MDMSEANTQYDKDALRSLRKLNLALEEAHRIDPKMPVSYLMTFLVVALKPGEGPTEYAKMLGTTQPAVSLRLMELGSRPKSRDEAYGLVERKPHPEHLARVMYELTPKGHTLARKLIGILEM